MLEVGGEKVRLMILGLLTKRESLSGYEIQQALNMVQSKKWAEVFPASIYHAIKKKWKMKISFKLKQLK